MIVVALMQKKVLLWRSDGIFPRHVPCMPSITVVSLADSNVTYFCLLCLLFVYIY